MSTKVLLDTDIGSDIDDAVALAYLLANRECELLGITTVTGQPEKRAQLADVLCRAAGRSIPIFPGSEYPLLVAQKQVEAQQAPALEKWPHESDFPQGGPSDSSRRQYGRIPERSSCLPSGRLPMWRCFSASIPGSRCC